MIILQKLDDLILQATQERSHYYVKSVCEEAKSEIIRMETILQRYRLANAVLAHGLLEIENVFTQHPDCPELAAHGIRVSTTRRAEDIICGLAHLQKN